MTYPFERAAMQNDPMPEGLTGAEQILYQGLALLYSRYRSGQLSREQGRREKAQLVRRFEQQQFQCKTWEQMAKRWSALEPCVSRFRAAKTEQEAIQAARAVIETIYGVPMIWEV